MASILMRTTAADGIYKTLRDLILGLRLKPGQELNVVELTEQLRVSRSPVRDALMKLANDKLVDIFPQKGTRVSLLDLKQVEEERFIRISLEEHAVQRFMEQWKSSDISAMESCVARQRLAAGEHAYEQFILWDDEFHSIIFNAIGHARSWELIQSQCGNYHRIRLLSFWAEGVPESVIAQHEDLISALCARNLQKLLDVEHHHLSKLLSETQWMVEKYPRFFAQDTPAEGLLGSVFSQE